MVSAHVQDLAPSDEDTPTCRARDPYARAEAPSSDPVYDESLAAKIGHRARGFAVLRPKIEEQEHLCQLSVSHVEVLSDPE